MRPPNSQTSAARVGRKLVEQVRSADAHCPRHPQGYHYTEQCSRTGDLELVCFACCHRGVVRTGREIAYKRIPWDEDLMA